jgi:hypothetical protein
MPITGDKSDFNLKTVLYATDFSPASESAGFYAGRLAAHFSATLLVAHAFTPTQAAMEVETAQSRPSQQRKDLQALLTKKPHIWSADRSKRSRHFLKAIRKK